MLETLNKPETRIGMPEADHAEGQLARKMEDQTAKLPSDLWLWAAGLSMAASLVLQVSRKKSESQFVGQWAAPLLLIGVYNKLVKVAGSDRLHP